MIKSMTGFGNSSLEKSSLKISVEIKTLNSKYLDVQIKLPKEFSDREFETKSLLSEKLQRGKVSVSVDYVKETDDATNRIDEQLFHSYYDQLKRLASKTGEKQIDLFHIAAQLPEIVKPEEGKISEDDWKVLQGEISKAIDRCDEHRKSEGDRLMPVLEQNVNSIQALLDNINDHDKKRIESIKSRIGSNLKEHLMSEKIDQNRFEQEVIYYLEKLDITEEKVRLKSHLDFFLSTLKSPTSQGKKLGFITQEMGREINTIGSKANYAPIQHLVVEMKEELEKVREQLLNIL